MKTEELEDGDVCPYCGVLAIFFEGASMINCPNCASELYNVGLDDEVSATDLDDLDPEVDDADEANDGDNDSDGDSDFGGDEGDF
jgi:hypothetical protein